MLSRLFCFVTTFRQVALSNAARLYRAEIRVKKLIVFDISKVSLAGRVICNFALFQRSFTEVCYNEVKVI